MDRAYNLINHFTTAFLLATLKDDTDAAAALACMSSKTSRLNAVDTYSVFYVVEVAFA
jgi:hypothetical protein